MVTIFWLPRDDIPTADIRVENLYTNDLVDAFNRFQPEAIIAAAQALPAEIDPAGVLSR